MSNPVSTLHKIDTIARVILGGERIKPIAEDRYEWMFPEYKLRTDTPRMSMSEDDLIDFDNDESAFWVSGLVLGWYEWMAKKYHVEIESLYLKSESAFYVQLRTPWVTSVFVAPSLHMALFEAMYLWAKQKEEIN